MVWPQQVVAIQGFAALTHGAHATHKIIASDCRNHWQPRHMVHMGARAHAAHKVIASY